MIRVVIFEDNKNLRDSLAMYLGSREDFMMAGAFGDARNALWAIKKHKPDVILMDIQMPHVSGLEATLDIKNCIQTLKYLFRPFMKTMKESFKRYVRGRMATS